jgi:hypothetical protein
MEDTSRNHAMLRHMETNVKFLTHATLGSWTHVVEGSLVSYRTAS